MLTTVEKEKDRGRDQKKRRVRKKEAKLPSTYSSKRGLSRLSAVAAEVSGFVADGAWRYFVNEDHEPRRGNQPEAGGHFQRSTSSLDEYFLTGDRMSGGTSSARGTDSREKSSIRPSFAARQSLAAMAREVKEEEERRASRRFAVEGTEDGHDQVTGQSVQADHDGMSNVFRKIVAEGAKTSQSKRSWFFKQ